MLRPPNVPASTSNDMETSCSNASSLTSGAISSPCMHGNCWHVWCSEVAALTVQACVNASVRGVRTTPQCMRAAQWYVRQVDMHCICLISVML